MLVDTSVWSLAMRRDAPPDVREVSVLSDALGDGEAVFTTGLVLQELLQGFSSPRARARIIDRFAVLPLLIPDRRDHIEAAELRNDCRRKGMQVGTVDALLAQLCLRHELALLTTDRDFRHIAGLFPLRIAG